MTSRETEPCDLRETPMFPKNDDFLTTNQTQPIIQTPLTKLHRKSSILNLTNTQREKLVERSRNFANEVSAHGIGKIVNSKVTWIKVFWFSITLISIVGFGAMAVERVQIYNISRETVTYTSNTRYQKDGVELPSISVCQEGFNTDFVLRDMVLEYDEKLGNLMESPGELIRGRTVQLKNGPWGKVKT